MRNRAGMNTSVVFGFTKFLRDIQKREHPDLLGVAFDPKGGSFRREIFPEYKANRAETPEDILLSVPYVKRIVEAMCIPVLEVPGYEADDVIGTLAHKGVEAGYDVFMVTPDKDYGQLVCDNCKIYKQKGNDGIEIVGREAIREKYGIENPQLVRDILALWGDASDNIPGVPGIGEKTACKLVQEWGTVENILQNADRIKSRQGEKIAEWGDKLLLAKRLTTICLDVPIDFREEDLTVCAPRIDELKALFADKTALDNIAEGLITVWKQPKAEARATALGILKDIGLAEKQDAYPASLSGGQQQRVGLARAMVRGKPLLLLDEPFSALDPALRREMLAEVAKLACEQGITVLMVSHNPEDAQLIADQVLFVDEGRIALQGKPDILQNSEHPCARPR
jgi:DNA polymerase-1